MNPADFFMLELSQFKELEGHKTKMTAYAWNDYEKRGEWMINREDQKG